ncbi:MAG: hypothetical protein AMXMBFR7_52700 [Planctomycetota bacterium]
MGYIEGYGSAVSIAAGEAISIHVSTDCADYSLEVFREGVELRSMLREEKLKGAEHPVPEEAWSNGCGWPVAYTLKVPSDWPSGAYRVRLSVKNVGDRYQRWGASTAEHDILFVIRAVRPGSSSPILLELCTNTYAAYNNWGGHSLYGYNSKDKLKAARVSFNRPGLGYYGSCRITRWETHFIQWCDRNNIKLEYATNYDLESHPEILSKYKLICSVGHDEYWSWPMRDNIERYIGDGGNVAFMTGNAVCWQVRFEDSGRTMRCHKEASDADPLYHTEQRHLTTARWNVPPVNRPENTLTGVGWDYGGYHRSHGMHMDGSGAYTVKRANHWVYEGTGLKDGDAFGGADTIVGYETDGCLFAIGDDGKPHPTGKDGTPLNFEIVAQAPAASFAGHDGTACMGVYQRGGTVFTAGTTDWAHGLDRDAVVQRITKNLIQRLAK